MWERDNKFNNKGGEIIKDKINVPSWSIEVVRANDNNCLNNIIIS